METRQVLNEREVDNEFGLRIPYLRRCRSERRGPPYLKIGKLVRYRRSDIEAFLSAHAVEMGQRSFGLTHGETGGGHDGPTQRP